jgi:hypothetical protein
MERYGESSGHETCDVDTGKLGQNPSHGSRYGIGRPLLLTGHLCSRDSFCIFSSCQDDRRRCKYTVRLVSVAPRGFVALSVTIRHKSLIVLFCWH